MVLSRYMQGALFMWYALLFQPEVIPLLTCKVGWGNREVRLGLSGKSIFLNFLRAVAKRLAGLAVSVDKTS